MRRRKLLWTLAALTPIAAAAFLLLRPPPPSRVTLVSFLSIQNGMSRAEVEAILGPPGDYSTGPIEIGSYWLTLGNYEEKSADGVTWSWETDAAHIDVRAGADGVRGKQFWDYSKPKQGPLDNVLWRLKRLWRRWFP